MALATYPVADQSASIVRKNMARIKLLTVAGPLLCHTTQAHRVVRPLEHRRSWGIECLLVMLAVYNNDESIAAKQLQSGATRDLARYIIVQQKGHNETVGNAIDLFRQRFDSTAVPNGSVSTSHVVVAKGSRTLSRKVKISKRTCSQEHTVRPSLVLRLVFRSIIVNTQWH